MTDRKRKQDPLRKLIDAAKDIPITRSNPWHIQDSRFKPMIVPLPEGHSDETLHDMIDKHEAQNVDLLLSFIGGSSQDRAIALRMLRKHGGDMEKAANAYFEGDRGEDPTTTPARLDTPPRLAMTRPGNNSPIDLTNDDDNADLEKAIKASLEGQNQAHSENALVPSQRAPDPNWAVVPSNVASTGGGDVGMSQDEQTLSRAIEASLESGFNDLAADEYEPLPIEKQVRAGGRPIALRPTLPTLAYAALVLQGLFFVPQVRRRLAEWRPSAPPEVTEIPPPLTGPEHILWSLMEIFVNMDLAQLSELNIDASLLAFDAVPWSSAVERVGDLSYKFFSQVATISETLFVEELVADSHDGPKPRLFHFLYGQGADPSTTNAQETSIVKVEAGPALTPLLSETPPDDDIPPDLLSRLAANLPASGVVILEPSAVVAFQLGRALRYPLSIFLDQFLLENAALAEEKRSMQRMISAEIKRLVERKKTITHFDNKDVLADLRSSLYYYENVAEAKGNLGRQGVIDKTKEKLRRVLEQIEREQKAIDEEVAKLKKDAAGFLDSPEMQKHRYDLRVVFVHDGLFGRKHLYSYVRDKGTWWKTADSSVEEVSEETVLNDPAGLHLGAGPYLVIYSRALPDEEVDRELKLPWPEDVKNSVKHNNKTFLSQLPPEIAEKVLDRGSPPSSPSPLGMTLSIGTSSGDDFMDVTS